MRPARRWSSSAWWRWWLPISSSARSWTCVYERIHGAAGLLPVRHGGRDAGRVRVLGSRGEELERMGARRAIPAALDLLILSVEAGQSLNQAIVESSLELHDAHPDLSDELAQVNLELRAGKSRADALQQLGTRNGDPELKKLSSLLIDSD